MAELDFNQDEVPASEYQDLPNGDYVAAITESEWKTTKDGAGQYLALTFQVLKDEAKGRKVWLNLNLKNHNETAVTIAKQQLKQICEAVGYKGLLKDSCQLHDQPLVITIGVNKRGESGIRKFKSILNNQVTQAATTTTNAPKYTWQQR